MDEQELSTRMADSSVNLAECYAAMKGEKIPTALGNPVTQFCLVRGIRYNFNFARDIRHASPEILRAWNARAIMSNEIPAIDPDRPEQFPYCIWHPEVATKSTYRALVDKYPQMQYHVARACAVAGYTDLYRQLNVLPEVHVAEEARDNGHFDIFEDIVSAPVKYSIMNDYKRKVKLVRNDEHGTWEPYNLRVACLNGDTAVRSSLDVKLRISMPLTISYDDLFDEPLHEEDIPMQTFFPGYLNITEDGNIDTYDGRDPPSSKPTPDLSHLLYSPLPQDLPAGNKDVLILMAAYYGDIDRYSRLRRPMLIPHEMECLMRGIYHNTLFAKWCADNLVAHSNNTSSFKDNNSVSEESPEPRFAWQKTRDLHRAITARYIMNNDLSRITAETPDNELPYCIWYPGRAYPETLRALVARRPEMRQQAARACIVANWPTVFAELGPEPDAALLAEAKHAGDPHFAAFLQRKVDQGASVPTFSGAGDRWRMITREEIREPQIGSTVLFREVDEMSVAVSMSFPGIYEGYGVDTGALELSVSARNVMLKDGEDRLDLLEAYQ